MCQGVRLYNVVDIVVMSGNVVCCSEVCVCVSMVSIMCYEWLIMSEIIWSL